MRLIVLTLGFWYLRHIGFDADVGQTIFLIVLTLYALFYDLVKE